MKRIFLPLLLAMMLVTACQSGPPKRAVGPEPPPRQAVVPAPPADKLTTIRVVVLQGHPLETLLDRLIPAFHEQYPTYRIEKVYMPDGNDQDSFLAEKARRGEVDVMPAQFLTYLDESRLMDLRPYLNKNKFDLTPFGNAIELFGTGTRVYLLPYAITPTVLLVNKAHMSAAGVAIPVDGWTWDEFREVARKISRPDEGVAGLDDPPLEHLAGVWLEGRTGTPLWQTTPEALGEAVAYFQTLVQTDRSAVAPPTRTWPGIDYAAVGQRFPEGRAALTMGVYVPEWNDSLPFDWAVAPMPYHAGRQRVSMAIPWAYGIAQGTANPDAAWTFVSFAAGPQGAAVMARSGVLPAHMTDAAREAWNQQVPAPPAVTGTFFRTKWTFTEADVGDHESVRRFTIHQAVFTAFNGGVTGRLTVEGALEEFRKAVEHANTQ